MRSTAKGLTLQNRNKGFFLPFLFHKESLRPGRFIEESSKAVPAKAVKWREEVVAILFNMRM